MPRTVLITGCSSGIGRALALAFVDRGDQVVATARRVETLTALTDAGCTPLALDVNSKQSRQALLSALKAAGISSIDILVNNAGISAMGPLLELPEDKLRGQFETNVIAPVLLVQSVFPLLQRSQQPVIVNIGSVSGILTTPFAGAYCASKAALHSMSEAMRMELQPFGIQVVTIQPGAIQSNFGDAAASGIDDWLDEDSRYAPIRDGIMARAGASQVGATPTAEFATAVVAGLDAKRPETVQRLGRGSRALPLLHQLVPSTAVSKILSRKFGLSKLHPDG